MLSLYVNSPTKVNEDPIMYGPLPILNSVRIVIASLMLCFQFEVNGIEISTQKEEMSLLCRDRKFALLALFYQLCHFVVFIWKYTPSGSEEASGFGSILADIKDPKFYYELLYLISVIFQTISAHKFSCIIKQSTKDAMLKLYNLVINFLKFILLIYLCYSAFFQLEYLVYASFLVICCLVHIFLAEYASSPDINRAEQIIYGDLIKWFSLVLILLVEVAKVLNIQRDPNELSSYYFTSLFRFDEVDDNEKIDKVHYFMNTISQANTNYLMLLLGLAKMYSYCKRTYAGLQMEFFDAQLNEDPSKLYMYGGVWQKGQDIDKPDTLMEHYFGSNMYKILDFKLHEFFKKNGQFKHSYTYAITEQSQVMKARLEMIQLEYIKNLTAKRLTRIIISKLLRWVRLGLADFIVKRSASIVRIIIHIYCALDFMFYNTDTINGLIENRLLSTLNYTLLFWNLTSIVYDCPVITKRITQVVYVSYLVDYCIVVGHYVTSLDEDVVSFADYISQAFQPRSMASYCIIFIMISFYTLLVILIEKNGSARKALHEMIGFENFLGESSSQSENQIQAMFVRTYSILIFKEVQVMRYIPLFCAVLIALESINILNMVLLIAVFLLIYKNDKDYLHWPFFMFYNLVLLLLKFFGNALFPFHECSVELVAILGITTIDEEVSKDEFQAHYLSLQMVLLFALFFFTTTHYRSIVSYRQKACEEDSSQTCDDVGDDNQIGQALIARVRSFSEFVERWQSTKMVWIYHIFYNLILISYKRNIVSSILFFMESLLIIVHLLVSRSPKSSLTSCARVLQSISFILTLAYAVLRYMMLFLGYNMIYSKVDNTLLRKLFPDNYEEFSLTDAQSLQSFWTTFANYSDCFLLVFLGLMSQKAYSLNTRIRNQAQARKMRAKGGQRSKFGGNPEEYENGVSDIDQIVEEDEDDEDDEIQSLAASRESWNSDFSGSGEGEFEGVKDKKIPVLDMEEVNVHGNNKNGRNQGKGVLHESEIISKISNQKKATTTQIDSNIPNKKFSPKNLNQVHPAQNGSKLATRNQATYETLFGEENSQIETLKKFPAVRSRTLMLYFLFKGLAFPVQIWMICDSMTIFKLIIVCLLLLEFRGIVYGYSRVIRNMRLSEVMSLVIRYFRKRFVKGKQNSREKEEEQKGKGDIDDLEGIELQNLVSNSKRDYLQLECYFEQFVEELYAQCFKSWESYTKVTLYLILIFQLLLWVYSYIVEQKEMDFGLCEAAQSPQAAAILAGQVTSTYRHVIEDIAVYHNGCKVPLCQVPILYSRYPCQAHKGMLNEISKAVFLLFGMKIGVKPKMQDHLDGLKSEQIKLQVVVVLLILEYVLFKSSFVEYDNKKRVLSKKVIKALTRSLFAKYAYYVAILKKNVKNYYISNFKHRKIKAEKFLKDCLNDPRQNNRPFSAWNSAKDGNTPTILSPKSESTISNSILGESILEQQKQSKPHEKNSQEETINTSNGSNGSNSDPDNKKSKANNSTDGTNSGATGSNDSKNNSLDNSKINESSLSQRARVSSIKEGYLHSMSSGQELESPFSTKKQKINRKDIVVNILTNQDDFLQKLFDGDDEMNQVKMVMSEKSTKTIRILYIFHNKNKYQLACSGLSLFRVFSRVILIPAFITLTNHINLLSLPVVVLFLFHSNRDGLSIFQNLEQLFSIYLVYSVSGCLHLLFFDNLAYFFENETIRYLIDGDDYLLHFLRPLNFHYFSIKLMWFSGVVLCFAMSLLVGWYVFTRLFVLRGSDSTEFHKTMYGRFNRRYLTIDYKEWKKAPLLSLNFLSKFFYRHTMEIHNFITVGLMITLGKPEAFSLYAVLLITFLFSLYEVFRRREQGNNDLIISFGRNSYIYTTLQVYWAMYILCFLVQQLNHIFNKANQRTSNSIEPYLQDGFLTVVLFTITSCFRDFTGSPKFAKERASVQRESQLKRQYTALNWAYRENESKLYYRLKDMMSSHSLNTMSHKLIDFDKHDDIVLNFDYMNTCLINNLKKSRETFVKTQLGILKYMEMKLVQGLYEFLNWMTLEYSEYDLLYLFINIKQRNKETLKKYNLNLADFFGGQYSFFRKAYRELNLNFSKLADYDKSSIQEYEKRQGQTFRNLRDMNDIADEKRDGDVELIPKDGVNLNYNNMRNQRLNAAIGMQLRPGTTFQEGGHSEFISRENNTICSNFLVDYLTSAKNSAISVESFIQRIKNRGYVHCMFGKQRVVLYNLKTDHFATTKGYNQLHWSLIFSKIFSAMIFNFEILLIFMLSFQLLYYGGALNFFVIGIILFRILIEEQLGRSGWWKVIYICFLCIPFLKVMEESISNKKHGMFGLLLGLENPLLILFPILSTLLLIETLKRKGFSEKSLCQFENMGEATARLILNSDLNGLIDRFCQHAVKNEEYYYDFITERLSLGQKDSGANQAALKLSLVKRICDVYKEAAKFKKQSQSQLYKLMHLMRNEIFSITNQKLSNFNFRNFSSQQRKKGGTYFMAQVIVLAILIIYSLVVLPVVESNSTKREFADQAKIVTGILAQPHLDRLTLFSVVFYLTCLFVEYTFHRMDSHDNLGIRNTSIQNKLLSEINFSAYEKKKEGLTPYEKLQKIARQVRYASTLARSARVPFSQTYRLNPHFYYYFYLMIIWVFASSQVFFVHPLLSRGATPPKDETLIEKYLCVDPKRQQCLQFHNNEASKMFYFLNILYIFLGIQTVRAGKTSQGSQIYSFGSQVNKISYHTIAGVPLVRPFMCIFDFVAAKTCLFSTDYILLDDLRGFIHKAKIEQTKKILNPVGREISRKYQVFSTLFIVFIAIFMLIMPLMIFSNTSNNDIFKIDEGKMSIDLYDGEGKILSNLYIVDQMRENKIFDQELYESRDQSKGNTEPDAKNQYDIYPRDFEKKPQLASYRRNRFHLVSFSSSSNSFLELTPSNIDDLIKYLEDTIDDKARPYIKFKIEMKSLQNPKYGIHVYEKNLYLDPLKTKQMRQVLKSGCQTPQDKINSELFLEVVDQILVTNKEKFDTIKVSSYSQKISLVAKCSADYQNYMVIPTNNKNPVISFIVITETKNGVFIFIQNMTAPFFDSKIVLKSFTIQSIYLIIFVVIGVNFVRPLVTGQTVRIWFENIPRTDVILIIYDAINNARREGDLIKEELLFLLLMDIMRNPDILRKFTDSELETRTDMYKDQMKGIKQFLGIF